MRDISRRNPEHTRNDGLDDILAGCVIENGKIVGVAQPVRENEFEAKREIDPPTPEAPYAPRRRRGVGRQALGALCLAGATYLSGSVGNMLTSDRPLVQTINPAVLLHDVTQPSDEVMGIVNGLKLAERIFGK